MKKFVSLILVIFLLIGCVDTVFGQSVIVSQQTQLQKRQYQTRTYNNISKDTVMKAMINVLQDEDFIIDNADSTLGFISGTKEFSLCNSSANVQQELGTKKWPWMATIGVVETTANVSDFGKGTRIRVNFKRKTMSDYGNAYSIEEITEPEYYQNFFAKVDKAIFIQKQKI